jgi:hypothetical protein
MKTTIDNRQRKFYIHMTGWSSDSWICNLADIPAVVKEIADAEPYKICEIWNHTIKPLSKKKVNELFAANQIDFKF